MHLKYISFNNVFDVVDKTDTTYFKILGSGYGRKVKQNIIDEYNGTTDRDTLKNPSLAFEFNHMIDPGSAIRKENYSVNFGNEHIKIRRIEVEGGRLIISLNDTIRRHGEYSVFMQNIKDIDGRILNRKRTVEYFQYRELFVQDHNNNLLQGDSCLLQNTPLKQNCISKNKGDQKYWMNTPENVKIEN